MDSKESDLISTHARTKYSGQDKDLDQCMGISPPTFYFNEYFTPYSNTPRL